MDQSPFSARNRAVLPADQIEYSPTSSTTSVPVPIVDLTGTLEKQSEGSQQHQARIRIKLTQSNMNGSHKSPPQLTNPVIRHIDVDTPMSPMESSSAPLPANRDSGFPFAHSPQGQQDFTFTNGSSRYKSESLSPAPDSFTFGSPSIGEDSPHSSRHANNHQNNSVSPSKAHRRRRPEPVFITSRNYAPVPPEIQAEALQDSPPTTSNNATTMKRTDQPTRMKAGSTSKNDAVVGSNGHHSGHASETSSIAGFTLPNPNLHPLRRMQRGADYTAPPLPFNFSSVDNDRVGMIPTYTCTPRKSPPRVRPRLFELEEAPTFYPSKEEFADPLSYIQWVGDPKGGNGKAYGIVKIVPPEDWHPDFVLDQNRFRFRTRMQRLNSLSADARASLNYQEQLQKFHAQQGHARVSIPVVDRRPVDLYLLKLTVGSMGGHESISKTRRWADVTRKLGYEENSAAHLAAQIKAAYTKIILPFEKFLVINREAVRRESGFESNKQRTTSPEQTSFSVSPSSSRGVSHAHTAPANQLQFDSHLWNTSSTGDQSLDDSINGSSKRRSTRRSAVAAKAATQSARPKSPEVGSSRKADLTIQPGAEEQMCEICLRGDNGTSMLLCDDCNRGYHMHCLDPPLVSVPKSEWYCPPCLVGSGNDYGFEDGENHSLSSFWNRAENFRAAWWSERKDKIWTSPDGQVNGNTRAVAGTGLRVSEDDVEREFWRLVHSPDENVEVEYGADVHSTTHGSAMPTLETHPLSPYSRDGWNLNNLPILPLSLLRYIKSDISGMTVPWIYVGMIFSTFCWHNEDHYTYSINYQHFGDTKTWYGVPGSDAHLLEEALKAAAPDLFEQCPELLFQLVTMMSPDKLKKHGVKMYACDQRANEFVITFPKAYHCGFNHGFNLNEAVNFALPDWIDYGLEAVRRYQHYRRAPVFSHDELVMTVYQHNQSVDTAMWLQTALEEMIKREIEQRNELRRLVPNITEIDEEVDREEVDYQCTYCNTFCYLSQVISEKAEGVACCLHANQVCGVDSPTKWILRTRYTDETLTMMLAKTVERAAIPTTWKARLRKVIVASPQPSLRNLRGLLHEGEKIPFEMPEVDNLRIFVEKANRWVEEATTLIARKHQKRVGVAGTLGRDAIATLAPNGGSKRGGVAKSGRRGSRGMDDDDDADSSVADLADPERVYALMEETKILPFDAPEVNALRGVVDAIEEFKMRCNQIMQSVRMQGAEPKLRDCEEVLSLGNSINVRLDEVGELQQYVGKRRWIEEVEEHKESFLQVNEVDSLIAEGVTFGVAQDDPLMKLLQERKDHGVSWKRKAEAILGLSPRLAISNGSAKKFTQEEAEELRGATYKVPVDNEMMAKIETLIKHAKEWTKQCELLIKDSNRNNQDEVEASKKYSEACRLLRHLDESTIAIKDQDKLMKMKMIQESIEKRIAKGLFGQIIEGDPNQVTTIAAQIKTQLLGKLEECCAEEEEICICRSNKGEKGPTARCSECSNVYHIKCLGLEKKTAKEKDWACPLCKPVNLMPLLVSHQSSKKTMLEIQEILSLDKIVLLENESLHPWGISPSYRSLQKIVELAARLGETVQKANLDEESEQVNFIKTLLYSPIRILSLDHSRRDVLMKLVEKLYARHGLDANGAEKVTLNDTASHNQDMMDFTQDGGEDISMMNTTGEVSDGEREGNGGKKSRRSGDERRKKRGKRAKFVFEQEVGIFVPINGERIYCLCHEPKSGKMISCERCALWFHNKCVHVYSEADLGEEKWICPMCCVKTERKYPQAEVKVKAPGERNPNMWLDVRATLRSIRGPVSKIQQWTVSPDKRIVLALESFYPATAPTKQEIAQDDNNKRQKMTDGSPASRHTRGESNSSSAGISGGVNTSTSAGGNAAASSEVLPFHPNALGSVARNTSWNDQKARVTPKHRTPMAEERARMESQQAQERHHAGMQNLYSRGVTDAMIQKWYVGWNGHDLVYPRKDRLGRFHDLVLGPRIHLASDDQDGTKLIHMLLEEEAEDRRRREGIPTSQSQRIVMEDTRHHHRSQYPSTSSSSIPGGSSNNSRNPIQRSMGPKAPPPPIELMRSHDEPRHHISRPISAIPPYRSGTMNLPPPPSAPISTYRTRSPPSADVRSPAHSAGSIYSRSPSTPQTNLLPQQNSASNPTSRREGIAEPPPPPPPHLLSSRVSTNSSYHRTPPSQYILPQQPSPRSSDRPEASSSTSSYIRKQNYNPHVSANSASSSTSSAAVKSSKDETGLKHSPRLQSISHNAPSLQQQQQQRSETTSTNKSSSSPSIRSNNKETSASPEQTEKDKALEKSLAEYRALARKMRPTASEEEIETMARAALL